MSKQLGGIIHSICVLLDNKRVVSMRWTAVVVLHDTVGVVHVMASCTKYSHARRLWEHLLILADAQVDEVGTLCGVA